MTKSRQLMMMAAVLAAGGVLGGCGGDSAKEQGAPEQQASKAPAGPVALSMMLTYSKPMPEAKDDPIKQYLDQKLGTNLTISTYLPDDQRTQLNVGLASGSSADMFYVNRQDLVRLAKSNLLLDLTPYLDKLKPAVSYVGEGRLNLSTYNGKVYGIPQTERAYQYSYWLRKDWLDKLNLQIPKTTEEFFNVAKAFAQQDPDGNGKNDTYGFSGRPTEALGPLFGAYGTTYPGSFYIKEGKLVNSVYDPAMKDALAYIKRFFDEKIIDPDFLANTKLQHKDKAYQGQLGMFYFNWPNIKTDEYKKVNPAMDWVQIEVPAGPAGPGAYAKDMTASVLAFPKSIEKDKDKVEKIIELVNYSASPEGSKVAMYGIKDKHYTEENGAIKVTEVLAEPQGFAYQFVGRDEMVYLKTKFPDKEKEFVFASKQPFISVYDSMITPPDGFVLGDAKRFIEEELWKFVNGKRDLATYGDFVAQLENTFKYKLYVQAAESQLKEQGILK
ncbi:extracellular solute-binding protein [Paenibacillus sp. YN15]|uniref:extracellular solute-binding protein n=1 Tax=Paenibacillus sp. YN15 TaxID=1742774 RepID=UPI0015EC4A9F|nr:extracellular solute-binding protein [Paenibacillus sp. YN15]